MKDVFGKALLGYWRGDKSPLYFMDALGALSLYPVDRYFRKELTKLEKQLVSLAYGRILDIGCATGYVLLHLNKRGDALGIDKSPSALTVAKELGVKTVLGDIYTYEDGAFDTLVLMENNLGLGGSLDRTEELLRKLKGLLAQDGQILATVIDIPSGCKVEPWVPCWKGMVGEPFSWIHCSLKVIRWLARRSGMGVEVLGEDYRHLLLRITLKGRGYRVWNENRDKTGVHGYRPEDGDHGA